MDQVLTFLTFLTFLTLDTRVAAADFADAVLAAGALGVTFFSAIRFTPSR